jgi:hypothetical protein
VGKIVAGRPVRHLSEVPPPDTCFVLPYVASRGATQHLSRFLEERGFVMGRSYLPAA